MQRFCQDHGWTHNPLNRQARCPATPIHPWKTRQKALASDPFSAACHSQKVPPSKPRRCNRLSESHTQVGWPPCFTAAVSNPTNSRTVAWLCWPEAACWLPLAALLLAVES
jgi:hypothetical protein